MAQHRDPAGPNGYWKDGKRYHSGVTVDLDALAAEHGYGSAVEMQEQDPEGYQLMVSQHPTGDVQVADQDNLDTHRFLNVLGGTVALGTGADYLAGLGGGSAAAAPAGVSATTGVGLPAGMGAVTLPATPAATAAAAIPAVTTTGLGATVPAPMAASVGVPASGLPTTALGAAPAGGGLMSRIGGIASKNGRAFGSAVNAATQAAANNRSETDQDNYRRANLDYDNERLKLDALRANSDIQSDLERQLLARGERESQERQHGVSDIYRQGAVRNPTASPFNPRGVPTFSPALLAALDAQAAEGARRVAQPVQYTTDRLPAVPSAPSYTPNPVTLPPRQRPGAMEQIGNYVGPVLSMFGRGPQAGS